MINKKQIIGIVSFFVIVGVLYITKLGCPIKLVTGISCPGCGLTRAGICVMHLNFAEAFFYHPLFWTIPILIVLFLMRNHIPAKFLQAILYVFIVLFLGVYFARLFLFPNEIVTADIRQGFLLKTILSWLSKFELIPHH